MTTPSAPTLWRTCRVLANRTRLQMLRLLYQDPPLSVSAVALRLEQPLPLASQSLRALEARGLLKVRRTGRRVEYRPALGTSGESAPGLGPALRRAFQREPHPIETLYQLATAFTHPRRIEIYRALHPEARTLAQLKVVTRISAHPLLRHLRKLEARGFVVERQGLYTVAQRPDAFGRALARLAGGEPREG